jgi:hypothetical protein
VNRVTLLVAAALCLALSGVPAPGSAQPAPEPGSASPDAAQVLRSEGQTLLVRGSAFLSPVRAEVPVRSGDRIRTGPDGFVQLRFSDGALISLKPGSDFRVDAWIYDAQHQRSFFELGALAERQFRRSVHAMITGDPGLIAQVLADERVGDEAKKIALKGRTGLEAANKPTTRPDPAPAMLAVLMYACASRRRLGPAR